jgi:beta-N-acetylhexosaminidase
MSLATACGLVMAAELRACGVDMSFAPVLDLDYGVSTVIGDRAFHRDPRVVAMLARALAQGMAMVAMSACGKHFPGHGAVVADSHHDIPIDDRALTRILKEDAAPYLWLGDLVIPAVMPAHVIYPKVDDKPAGFSKRWIQDVLRTQLHYDGAVFSDDLTMQGATVAGDITARAHAAIKAGCDMVLVCNQPEMADELLRNMMYEPNGPSIERVARLMPKPKARDWASLKRWPAYQHALRLVHSLNERHAR